MTSPTWPQVTARRLHRHGLAAAGLPDPAAAAAAICGAHAQLASAAELSLGVRVPGATRTTVRDALWRDRTLVKTRGPRGTVHLLAAADLPLWTGALSAVPAAPPDLLTPDRLDAVVAAVADAVAGAELTVDELTDAVVARTGPWAGDRVMDAFQDRWPRWRAAESAAFRRGAVCFGPNRGRRTTYTGPRRWLPGFTPLPPAEAGPLLVTRYLHAYGPSTPAHFARWLGVPPPWAAAQFAAAGLARADVEGAEAWTAAGDPLADTPAAGTVRLLPYFDAYVIGCHPREQVFPGRAAQRALAGGQAGNYPVLLIDGVAAGVWHQRRTGARLAITVEPLTDLTARQRRALDAEADRTAGILEASSVTLTIGPVPVGPHA
ncbi:winged helix DNA-binding domain-containing protein [Spirilliplanes yamanashiensis]|uniref:winged helix DNA-binding domain-containing protein n=1 Tax=Spirilliplanes yamanashiensis TaxID=42233 RepID=UPI001EF31CF5|nr:winged helix DNA-binding domain-containing protein [Spirilliplanes yamanashiensis]MDP9816596.1 hypothetical protein [Spirilliplanes yamanashiensis]